MNQIEGSSERFRAELHQFGHHSDKSRGNPRNHTPDSITWFDIGEAFRPWAVAVRKYTLRMGLASWPLAGFGCYIAATKLPLLVCAVDMKTLREKAEIQLLDQLDEALENKKVREIAWPMMAVEKGQTCWIPIRHLGHRVRTRRCFHLDGDSMGEQHHVRCREKARRGYGLLRRRVDEVLGEKNEDKPGLKLLCPAVSAFYDAHR